MEGVSPKGPAPPCGAAAPHKTIQFMSRGPARRSKSRMTSQSPATSVQPGPGFVQECRLDAGASPEPRGPPLPPMPRLWGVNVIRSAQPGLAAQHSSRFQSPPSGAALPVQEAHGRPYRDVANDPRQAFRRAARPIRTRGVVSPSPSTVHQANDQPVGPAGSLVVISAVDTATFMPLAADEDQGLLSFWVCIHQSSPKEAAYVYIHHEPLSSDLWDSLHVSERPSKQMSIQGCSFSRCWDIRGPWHNFYLQSEGGLPMFEEGTQWPNKVQLLAPHLTPHTHLQQQALAQQQQDEQAQQEQGQVSHSSQAAVMASGSSNSRHTSVKLSGTWAVSRCKYNWSSLEDVVWWLCDPSPASVRAHLANILRRAKDEPQQQLTPETIYNRLCMHWGTTALLDLGFTRHAVIDLVADPSFTLRTPAAIPPLMQLHYRAHIDQDLLQHTSLQSMTDSAWDMDVSYMVKTGVRPGDVAAQGGVKTGVRPGDVAAQGGVKTGVRPGGEGQREVSPPQHRAARHQQPADQKPSTPGTPSRAVSSNGSGGVSSSTAAVNTRVGALTTVVGEVADEGWVVLDPGQPQHKHQQPGQSGQVTDVSVQPVGVVVEEEDVVGEVVQVEPSLPVSSVAVGVGGLGLPEAVEVQAAVSAVAQVQELTVVPEDSTSSMNSSNSSNRSADGVERVTPLPASDVMAEVVMGEMHLPAAVLSSGQQQGEPQAAQVQQQGEPQAAQVQQQGEPQTAQVQQQGEPQAAQVQQQQVEGGGLQKRGRGRPRKTRPPSTSAAPASPSPAPETVLLHSSAPIQQQESQLEGSAAAGDGKAARKRKPTKRRSLPVGTEDSGSGSKDAPTSPPVERAVSSCEAIPVATVQVSATQPAVAAAYAHDEDHIMSVEAPATPLQAVDVVSSSADQQQSSVLRAARASGEPDASMQQVMMAVAGEEEGLVRSGKKGRRSSGGGRGHKVGGRHQSGRGRASRRDKQAGEECGIKEGELARV